MWASFKHKKTSGFTIVELLIVVVVIAILAAITIVSYNGIQNRSNAAASLSTASSVAKKAESFNAVAGKYPAFPVDFSNSPATSSTPDGSLAGTGIVLADVATKPAKPATIEYRICENHTGAVVGYWDYVAKTRVLTYLGTCKSTQSQTSAFIGGPY